jgi:hypothetical protein
MPCGQGIEKQSIVIHLPLKKRESSAGRLIKIEAKSF